MIICPCQVYINKLTSVFFIIWSRYEDLEIYYNTLKFGKSNIWNEKLINFKRKCVVNMIIVVPLSLVLKDVKTIILFLLYNNYTSVNKASICPDNGCLLVWHQASIKHNAGLLLSSGPKSPISVKFESKYKTFLQENAFENVFCKMAAILSQPQSVKSLSCMKRLASAMD